MEIIKAKTAGFCFGVRRAVDTVYEEAKKAGNEKIYTYGPIIHNAEVVKDLEKKGVHTLWSEEELDAVEEGTVIIRSHGVAEEIYKKMEKKGLKIVDATCPFVKKIHNIAKKQTTEGNYVVIIGDPEHPEVKGIKGWGGDNVTVINTPEDAGKFTLKSDRNLCIVAQTTYNFNKFKDLVEMISKKGYNVNVLNTICNATKERQTEAKEIADMVDAMIVIGDKHSSNTQKLFEICSNACSNTYYIQTLEDLDLNQLK